ncbi:hypothetical protein CRE_07774 [Caenorhabditis remanei]|uniref:Uncharacterized protein n=1 Tax=Caenorhabditis remanei TaxID=31234 RepID=E3NB54_CAERE|nr:hypothetical protein CRE_07774 [Caenorhabditis remanei]
MKIPITIAELVSSFSGLNRTPDFKPVTNCPGNSGGGINSGRTTPTQKYHGDRRHSTVITVGADKLPTLPSEPTLFRKASRSSNGSEVKYRKSRRQSAPCISTIAGSTCLKEKLNRLRSANSSGDEQDDIQEEDHEHEQEEFHVKNKRKQSVSYQVA